MNLAIARAATALLIALCLYGCPHRPGPSGPLQKFEDAQSLVEAVRKQAQKLDRLRLRGTVLARREGQRVKARFTAATALPASLRFETESFFDQPVSILVTDGMEFSLWDMEGGRFFIGRATPANLSRAIPVFLDGPEVVGMLRGEPPLIAFAESRIELEPDGIHYRVWLSNARERERLRIDGRDLRLLEAEVEVEGRRLYLLKLAAWEDRPRLPRELMFEMPSQKLELTMKIREAEEAEPFAEDVFRLEPPPGVPVETLDAP